MASILVVDDEVGIRELLSEILSDEGHVVTVAENASAARAARQTETPELVLLDIWMPDTDGVTLLKEWAVGGQLTMPVIMMSGHASIDTAVEATRFGALDFLEKPIAMARLLNAVKNGLERGRLMRNLRILPPGVPAPPPPPPPPPPEPDVGGAVERGVLKTSANRSENGVEGEVDAGGVNLDQPLRDARDQFERVYFEYHLARENYSMTRVADRAGLERTHLYRKLKQLGVELGRAGRRSQGSYVGTIGNIGTVGDVSNYVSMQEFPDEIDESGLNVDNSVDDRIDNSVDDSAARTDTVKTAVKTAAGGDAPQ